MTDDAMTSSARTTGRRRLTSACVALLGGPRCSFGSWRSRVYPWVRRGSVTSVPHPPASATVPPPFITASTPPLCMLPVLPCSLYHLPGLHPCGVPSSTKAHFTHSASRVSPVPRPSVTPKGEADNVIVQLANAAGLPPAYILSNDRWERSRRAECLQAVMLACYARAVECVVAQSSSATFLGSFFLHLFRFTRFPGHVSRHQTPSPTLQ